VFVAWSTVRLRLSFAASGSSAHPIAGREAYTIITQEIFDQFPNVLPPDQYQNFDSNYVPYNAAQAYPGPPTPPGQLTGRATATPANGAAHQPRPTTEILPVSKLEVDDQNRRQGSNSEDDDLTPAQSKRKAQNRAAYVADKLSPVPQPDNILPTLPLSIHSLF
jgi:hypothetical protein